MNVQSRVRVVGPMAPYVDGFRTELAARGYTPLSAANHLRLMAHMSRWLHGRRLQLQDLTPPRIDQFLRARRHAGYLDGRRGQVSVGNAHAR